MIYYVNNSAPKNGNGTKEMPFKFINDAAKIAKAGDEVLVAPGIYHEYVDPVNGGTEDARIVYKSEKPLGAKITGAEFLAIITHTRQWSAVTGILHRWYAIPARFI